MRLSDGGSAARIRWRSTESGTGRRSSSQPRKRWWCACPTSVGFQGIVYDAARIYRRLKKLLRGWEAETERLIDAAGTQRA